MNWKDVNEKGKLYYTIMTYNLKVEEIIQKINDKLNKVNNNMKNNFKKKIINQRLYPILEYLKDKKIDEVLNIIILSGKDLNIFNLNKKELIICNKWNLSNFYFESDERFKIVYLKNLLNENHLHIVFEIENFHLKILELDKVKSRIIQNKNIDNEDEFKKITDKLKPKFIHGSGSFIKKLKFLENIYYKKLTKEETVEKIKEIEIIKNQNILQNEVLSQLQNPNLMNKFLFGKTEISKGILEYMIQKLFITKKLFNSLKKNIESEYLNFKIIIIDKLKNGDIGDIFIKNYDGILGIKYY